MVDDESFLAELAEFLDESEPSLELAIQETVADLLLDSEQSLAETESVVLTTDTLRAVNTVRESSQDGRLRETKNGQAAKRRLKYRKKVENERKTLEQDENELSEELRHMQRSRKRVKSLWNEKSPMPVWKAIATRQKEGRLVAEEQQRRLKNAVETRAKAIDEIAQGILKQLFEPEKNVGVELTKQQQSKVQLNANDIELFEEYVNELDAVYSKTDGIFRACGVDKMPLSSFRLAPEGKRDGDVEYIDNLDVLFVPFTFEQTCSAMWQSMVSLNRREDRCQYDDVTDPKNTMAVKIRARVAREPVDMMVQFVTRRYVEPERMIVVWRALSQGEGDLLGKHTDETGWCVVRPNAKEGEDDMHLMRTVLQTFVRFIPLNFNGTSNDEVDGYQFTKLVVATIDDDADEVARRMGSLLLNDPS